MDKKALYIGLMSGTSLDAIDAALIDFSNGIELINAIEIELPKSIREEILALNSPCTNDLARSLVLDRQMAELLSEAVIELLKKSGHKANNIIAIGSHGQTLRHAPDNEHAYSLQVGNPSVIAEKTNITVVADFRSRDIAAGGQGAPLAPAFHQAALYGSNEVRAIINIGGMANISYQLDNKEITGFDTGPGNVLMDYWCQKHTGNKYDRNGTWASSGNCNTSLLQEMLSEPYFKKEAPKSTGRELFNAFWLEKFDLATIPTADVQATLLELTAQTIAAAIPNDIETAYLCGGGALNNTLLQRISELSQKRVNTTEQLGIPPQWIEATAFAWLAKQTINHQPGNAPEATGAKGHRILGGIYFNN